MVYQILARKWRPQNFSSVVGQEPIVTALRNALREGRVAQAYLFSGIRGVGKTSVARVLAKALNCENRPAEDPCNECVACREITAGSNLDVLEVDAATYSKVEQVRDLTESLKYGPARDPHKVVVIDEIHRLSRQAFDALLKIVEEPPPHLIFIFATTEVDAVPATVLSRCQEFHFRRVAPALLAEYMREIADAEHIEASDTSLRLIARAGEGSIRDSIALLDQLATFGSGRIPEEEVARIMGGVEIAIHHRLLAATLAGRGDEISRVVGEIEQEGWDPRKVFSQFLGYCRDALHLSLGSAASEVDLPLADAEELLALSKGQGYENLLRLLHQLLGSEVAVRRSESASLALEIALLRAAELPKLIRIEEILSGGTPETGPERDPRGAKPQRRSGTTAAPAKKTRGVASSSKPLPAAGADAPNALQAREREPERTLQPVVSAKTDSARIQEPVASAEKDGARTRQPTTGSELEGGASKEERFLQLVSRKRQSLAAHLGSPESIEFTNPLLRIFTAPGDTWLSKALERSGNKEILEGCLTEIWGPSAKWTVLERELEDETASEGKGSDPPESDPLLQHPFIQTALEIFGGSAETVDTDPQSGDSNREHLP